MVTPPTKLVENKVNNLFAYNLQGAAIHFCTHILSNKYYSSSLTVNPQYTSTLGSCPVTNNSCEA
jgi:hypothetical protein